MSHASGGRVEGLSVRVERAERAGCGLRGLPVHAQKHTRTHTHPCPSRLPRPQVEDVRELMWLEVLEYHPAVRAVRGEG